MQSKWKFPTTWLYGYSPQYQLQWEYGGRAVLHAVPDLVLRADRLWKKAIELDSPPQTPETLTGLSYSGWIPEVKRISSWIQFFQRCWYPIRTVCILKIKVKELNLQEHSLSLSHCTCIEQSSIVTGAGGRESGPLGWLWHSECVHGVPSPEIKIVQQIVNNNRQLLQKQQTMILERSHLHCGTLPHRQNKWALFSYLIRLWML